MSWAFNAFKANAAAFLALAAVVVVIQVAAQVSFTPIVNLMTNCLDASSPGQIASCQSASGAGVYLSSLLAFTFSLLAAFATIGVLRAALRTTLGFEPSFADMLTTKFLGRYIGFAIIFQILEGIGIVLCFLPGLVVIFFLELGHYFILDKGLGPIQAIKASFNVSRANVAPAMTIAAMTVLVLVSGAIFYGLPSLIVLPFAALFTAHMYRSLIAEPAV